jgi:4-alpha-glucanotransferase
MPPFAAFWKALDIEERETLGLLGRKSARAEQRNRRRIKEVLIAFLQGKGWLKKGVQDIFAITKACLAFLSASRTHVVLVNLEDLWLETQPQNMPGTEKEYPNWQRKARYSLEEFYQMPGVRDTLREIDALRKR